MNEINNKLKSIMAYVVIALAIVGIYALYTYYISKKDEPISFINTITKQKKLVSSYAFVGVAFYDIKSKKYKSKKQDYKGAKESFIFDDWYFQIDKNTYEKDGLRSQYQAKDDHDKDGTKIEGLCYKIYKVTYGYEDLNITLNNFRNEKKDVLPLIIGVEPIQTKYAGSIDQFKCNEHDLKINTKKRKKDITARLIIDGYYQYHMDSGCETLNKLDSNQTLAYNSCKSYAKQNAQNSDKKLTEYIQSKYCIQSTKSKDKTIKKLALKSAKSKAIQFFPQKQSESNIGDIVSLQVTLSTLNLATRGRWILKDHFFFRRDITEVQYGHSLFNIETDSNILNPSNKVNVYASPAQELYRNAYIANMHKNYASDRKIEKADMNSIVRESVNKVLNEHKKNIYSQTNKVFTNTMNEYLNKQGYELGFIKYQD